MKNARLRELFVLYSRGADYGDLESNIDKNLVKKLQECISNKPLTEDTINHAKIIIMQSELEHDFIDELFVTKYWNIIDDKMDKLSEIELKIIEKQKSKARAEVKQDAEKAEPNERVNKGPKADPKKKVKPKSNPRVGNIMTYEDFINTLDVILDFML